MPNQEINSNRLWNALGSLVRGRHGILFLGPLNSCFWYERAAEQRWNTAWWLLHPPHFRRVHKRKGREGPNLCLCGMIWAAGKRPVHLPLPPITTVSATDVGHSSKSTFLSLAFFEISHTPETLQQPWWVSVTGITDSLLPSSAGRTRETGPRAVLELNAHFDHLFIHCHPADKSWVPPAAALFQGAGTRWDRKCKEHKCPSPIASPSSRAGEGE